MYYPPLTIAFVCDDRRATTSETKTEVTSRAYSTSRRNFNQTDRLRRLGRHSTCRYDSAPTDSAAHARDGIGAYREV